MRYRLRPPAYSRNYTEAMKRATTMGYEPVEFATTETVVQHSKSHARVVIPCANHSQRRWTGASWARIMKALVLGATDEVRD